MIQAETFSFSLQGEGGPQGRMRGKQSWRKKFIYALVENPLTPGFAVPSLSREREDSHGKR